MIGGEKDTETAGSLALEARQSPLSPIPYQFPGQDRPGESLYIVVIQPARHS